MTPVCTCVQYAGEYEEEGEQDEEEKESDASTGSERYDKTKKNKSGTKYSKPGNKKYKQVKKQYEQYYSNGKYEGKNDGCLGMLEDFHYPDLPGASYCAASWARFWRLLTQQ
jgi:hypothetical protein